MTRNDRTTFFTSLHPGVKLAGAGVLSATSFAAGTPEALLVPGGLAVFLALTGGFFGGLIAGVRRLVWFLIVITAVSVFTAGGEILGGWDGFYATKEGLYRGLFLSARVLVASWWAVLLLLTTPPGRIVDGVGCLVKPFGRFGAEATLFLKLTIVFIPILVRSATAVKLAREARGHGISGGISGGIRNAGASAIPMLAAAVRAAGQLADAVDARGYDPGRIHTSYTSCRPGVKETVAALVVAATVAAAYLLSRLPS